MSEVQLLSQVFYLRTNPRYDDEKRDVIEPELVGRLAELAHKQGLRFDGWPLIEQYGDDTPGHQRLVATVYGVPR